MTHAKHSIRDQSDRVIRDTIELRWTTVQSEWSKPQVECGGAGRLNCRAEIVLSLQFVDRDHALIEMWLHASGANKRPKRLVNRQPVSCNTSRSSGMLHIDVSLNGRRAVALSIADDDRLMYAQCALLADLDFPGGAYHPPALRRVEAKRSVASA
jgi:hypothetical protein